MTIVQADSVRSTLTQRVIEFSVPGEGRGYGRKIRTASNRRYLVMSRSGGYTEMRTDNVVTARKRAEKVGGFVVDTLVPSNRVAVSAYSRSYPKPGNIDRAVLDYLLDS